MKMYFFTLILLCASLFFVACENNSIQVAKAETITQPPKKVLIIYFSEPLSDGVDANTSASRLVVNGEIYGSVEYLAKEIGKTTHGTLIHLKTEVAYPDNFDQLADLANYERKNNILPALSTKIENFDQYDVVFIGYPIWWYQMPMALYSFFEQYDFSHKTIIPFSSHGGSGWSGTFDEIAKLEPDAILVDGFSVSRLNSDKSQQQLQQWLKKIGMVK